MLPHRRTIASKGSRLRLPLQKLRNENPRSPSNSVTSPIGWLSLRKLQANGRV